MKKVLFVVYLVIGIILSLFAVGGIFWGKGVVTKILYVIGLIIVCPLVHYLIIKLVGKEKQNLIRIPCLVVGLIFLFITTGVSDFAPVEINDKELVLTAVEDLKNKYQDYDNLNVRSYDKVEEKKEGDTTIIKLKIVYDVIKETKITKKEDYYTVSFENGSYTLVK